jgi:hypothetical protein
MSKTFEEWFRKDGVKLPEYSRFCGCNMRETWNAAQKAMLDEVDKLIEKHKHKSNHLRAARTYISANAFLMDYYELKQKYGVTNCDKK